MNKFSLDIRQHDCTELDGINFTGIHRDLTLYRAIMLIWMVSAQKENTMWRYRAKCLSNMMNDCFDIKKMLTLSQCDNVEILGHELEETKFLKRINDGSMRLTKKGAKAVEKIFEVVDAWLVEKEKISHSLTTTKGMAIALQYYGFSDELLAEAN